MTRNGIPASLARFAISRIGHLAMESQRFLVDVRVGGGDEAFEQRMRLVRFAQKFRVELSGDEEWMVRQFDDFHELTVRRQAAEDETRLLKFVAVGVVEFVAMPVAFVDDERTVK